MDQQDEEEGGVNDEDYELTPEEEAAEEARHIQIRLGLEGLREHDTKMQEQLARVDELIYEVYGDTLHLNDGTHLDGGIGIAEDRKTQRLWRRVVANAHPLYEIPRGVIGNRFLSIQTDLWKGVRERKWNSEKALIFAPCILRKESGTKFAPDIRALITVKLDMWEAGKICSLVKATEDAAQGGPGGAPMS